MKLKFFDKHLDTMALALNPKVEVMTFEGTARSSKTIDAINCFYLAVKASPESLHCIACKDYNAIRDNILDANGLGLNNQSIFPDCKMAKERIGGYYLIIDGLDGTQKKVLLVGYANQNTWKAILGKTIGVFFIDECNTASENFIDETFSRQLSSDRPLHIFTLNGDDPKHFIYEKYINYCKPLGKVPQSILSDMEKLPNKKGWYYWHWDFHDNPVMTEEKIQRAMSVYNPSSYYYKTKILGERGIGEGQIYTLLSENPSDYILTSLEGYFFDELYIGVDFGGSGGGDKGGGSAHTFVCTGFGRNLDYVVFLESKRINAKGLSPNDLYDEFIKFSKMITANYKDKARNVNYIKCYCDNAEATLINGLDEASKKYSLAAQIYGAKKERINDRINAMQIMLSAKRVKWYHPNAITSFDAFRTAVYSKKVGHTSERLDDGTSDIDSIDASEYTFERKILEIQRKWGFKN